MKLPKKVYAAQKVDKIVYQNHAKSKVKHSSLVYLLLLQEKHSKIRNITYHIHKMQDIMRDKNKNSEDIGFLCALRARTVQGNRKDFECMFPCDVSVVPIS